jgi:hypothetical protein
MAEFVHTFRGGKMNKDLDERLIPEGEYRDALNLEVSSSEGSDRGAMQNIKGNLALNNKSFNLSTKSYIEWDETEYITGLTNATCIGSVVDTFNDNVYWLIASDQASVVARLDQSTLLVSPILVDTQNILSFSTSNLVTGINIFEDVLFWTDNNKEPKSLDIKLFENSTTSFLIHSTVYGRDFIESDITVIKKSPLYAPDITASASLRGGLGTGTTPVVTTFNVPNKENFTYLPDPDEPTEWKSMPTYAEALANPDEYPVGINGIVVITTSTAPNWQNNDIVNLTAKPVSGSQEQYEYGLVLLITSGGGTNTFTGQIQSISSNIEKFSDGDGGFIPIVWECLLQEGQGIFEFQFPRFAYRWKYSNNQYSTFSPFTNVVFVGGKFEYVSSDGYNKGMVNNLRYLNIENIEWGGDDVKEVEVLYKDSISQAVYLVDTLENRTVTSLEIKSEVIGAIIESNQILRPWDNVPRYAKSQEITGNRLLYGNYTQNYDVDELVSLTINEAPQIHPGTTPPTIDPITGQEIPNPENRSPKNSIKSIRTYQAGILYADEYGRETPVFTNNTASLKIEQSSASLQNALEIQANHFPPDWATHFKYFIKDTSNEYYNLALDRFYFAEDGNVWLSFPSSERNKVDEETYLYIKKQHDNDVAVQQEIRYKILSIQAEAPDFIATFKRSVAQSNVTILNGFEPDFSFLIFNGPTQDANDVFASGFTSDNFLRISDGANRTNDYEIQVGGRTGTGNEYTVTLGEPLGPDAAFLEGVTGEVSLTLLTNVVEKRPEFEGRFFAKINRDFAFEENIIASFKALEPTYGIFGEMEIGAKCVRGSDPPGVWAWLDDGRRGFGFCGNGRKMGTGLGGNGAFGIMRNEFAPPIQGNDYFGFLRPWNEASDVFAGIDGVFKTGALVRFVRDNGDYSKIYRILNSQKGNGRRGDRDYSSSFGFPSCGDWGDQREIPSNKRVEFWFRLEEEIEEDWLNISYWNTGGCGSTSLSGSPCVAVQVVQEIISDNNKLLTTTNPAIFETQPKEAVDIDIYYQATNSMPISNHGQSIVLDWFNCFSYGNGVESNRIRDDYNQPYIDKNPIASAPLDDPYNTETRGSGMIFSQIFNSNSGINGLNQFIQALPITKDLNPIYGSIQKLHSRDTNVVALCEDKILKVLANKDALFNADGSANVTSNNNVLGQAVPFAGQFGISKNPESFAQYGYRVYFTDKSRGVVLRLSNDGIEEISRYGMEDFFSDNLIANNQIIGSYDINTGEYNVSLNSLTPEWQNKLATSTFDRSNETDPSCPETLRTSPTLLTTLSFAEGINGWSSRKSFVPESGLSLNNTYYTFSNGLIWDHNSSSVYNNFYNTQYDSSVDLITNDSPNVVKGFKTLNYSGTNPLEYQYQTTQAKNGIRYSIAEIEANQLIPLSFTTKPGWYANYAYTDLQEGKVKEFITKEGKHFNYIKGLATYFNDTCDTNVNSQEFSVQGIGRADSITGDTEVTAYSINVCIDPECYNEIAPPQVVNQFYEGIEDTVMNIQLTGPTVCNEGGTVVYSLASNSTTGGVLNSVSPTGLFQFTPNLNYFGGAGSFNVNACCGDICSMFTVTLEILPVAENPYFVSDHPSLALQPGDCWEYNPIILADPDHAATDLIIQTPVPDIPSWLSQPEPLNDGTGNWYIPSSCLPEGASPAEIAFTMTVEDPDGNTGTQLVEGNSLAEAIISLEFLVTTRTNQPARSYTDPVTGLVTQMAPIASSAHGCNLGTYLVTGNGVPIGRAYVSNIDDAFGANNRFDTFTTDPNGIANSPTGDVMSDVVTGATQNVPSAAAQGVTSTVLYNPTDTSWAGYNFPQKYITAGDNFAQPFGALVSTDRYNLLTIDAATANDIINNSPDPDNPSFITFALVPDTYTANGVESIHGDGVAMQIFQAGVEVYSAIEPNNSALTLDVLTGNIIP